MIPKTALPTNFSFQSPSYLMHCDFSEGWTSSSGFWGAGK